MNDLCTTQVKIGDKVEFREDFHEHDGEVVQFEKGDYGSGYGVMTDGCQDWIDCDWIKTINGQECVTSYIE